MCLRFWHFFLILFFFHTGFTREHIHIVGSTAVFSFTATIAEEFARAYRTKTPVVESTGTSAGFKLFCSGVGPETPDIVAASRKINDVELALCKINSIDHPDIEEIKLGDDAIVVASYNRQQKIDFTKKDIFRSISFYTAKNNLALKPNSYKRWNQIRNGLPDYPIKIYGPMQNTGTFDSVVSMILVDQCPGEEAFKMTYSAKDIQKFCSIVRGDGVYTEVGGDENALIQKLVLNKKAFGLISYSFLSRNANKVMAHMINGIEPTYQTIESGLYPVSRPMYIYVKKPHLKLVQNTKAFLNEVLSEEALGSYGYLRALGIVPPKKQDLDKMRARVNELY